MLRDVPDPIPLLSGPRGPERAWHPNPKRSSNATKGQTVRAKLRVMVKRILKKHGYPPDKQEKATYTVLAQAELLSDKWISA